MAGMDYPQRSIATPPPLVVDARKAPPPFVDDSTAFKIGAATRTGLGVAGGTAADITQLRSPVRMLGGMAMDAVAPPVRDFGKGLLGMNDAPTAAPVTPPAPKPVTAALPDTAAASDNGTLYPPTANPVTAAPAPVAAPAAAAPSPEAYPTAPPQGISQYLPQLMAAAASRDSMPVVNTTAPPSPFTNRAGDAPITGSWDDFLNNKYQRATQAKANQTNIEAFNAGTQRRTADVGALTALAEPIKADAANQTHLAATGMTANTSRATTEATNATHLKAGEIAGQYAVKRSEAIAGARRYAADVGAKGKGSAVHYATSPDGKIVATQLNDKGELASRVLDPPTALAHQQADVAVMNAQHGEEVKIPGNTGTGGVGIVKIVNGVRKVYDKKTGKDIGWTPPAQFSTVGMPPAGGGSSNQLEDFLLEQ